MTTITQQHQNFQSLSSFSSLSCTLISDTKNGFANAVVDGICTSLGKENVSAGHKSALLKIAKFLTGPVTRNEPLKAVCELPTGTGKSTLMTYIISTAHNFSYDFPVCICIENLKEMNATYNKLIDVGVMPSDIACTFNPGSIKSRVFDMERTPREEWGSRKVLLCCHSVVDDTREDWHDRIQSRWGERFVFYDESLKRGEICTFTLENLMDEYAELSPHISSITVKNWIESLIEQLESAARSVRVEPCPKSTTSVIGSAAKKWKRAKGGRSSTFPSIEAITKNGLNHIYKLHKGYAGSIKKLPPLKKALVLDASYSHCPYTKWDRDISLITTEPFKKYRNVTTVATGRRGSKKGIDTNLRAELEHLAVILNMQYKAGKSVLVVCWKDYAASVWSAGASHVLTYGMHRGTNDYKDFDVVVLFGLLYPAPLHAAGSILLHGGDPEKEELPTIAWKQALVEAYQAVNRTVMRNCYVDENGMTQAKGQTIYMFGNLTTTQQQFWQDMLPDSVFITEGMLKQVERVKAYLGGSRKSKEKKADVRTAAKLRVDDGVSDRQWREVAKATSKQTGWIDDGGIWLIGPTPTPTPSY